MEKKPILHHLYVQVLIAIALGVLVGHFWPAIGTQLKPLGDGFIKLIKMIITPIIFCTVVVGIAGMGDMKKVGRVGLKALLYFEVVTSFALLIGLVVVKVLQPGAGVNADVASLNTKDIATYTTSAEHLSTVDFLLNIIPNNVVEAFAKGDVLQVLLFSVLLGLAIAAMGDRGEPLTRFFDHLSHALFGVVSLIMRLAPIGAFGAMAFTIGKYGIDTLWSLGKLMAGVYLTCFLFIFVVLALIMRANRLSLLKFLKYIREELFVVLGTSSSESVLPQMMRKLEHMGCSRSVVGMTIPTGYSFNLDGTCIYLTMAALFIAQACNVPLTLQQELTILLVLMLTSKGAAAVTGGGFITLAATLASVGTIPVAGLALILGVDRFMSEARALTNLIGNGVATVVVANWEGDLDHARAQQVLDGVGEPVQLAVAEGVTPERSEE